MIGYKTPDHWIMTGCLHCGAWTYRRGPCHICEKNPLGQLPIHTKIQIKTKAKDLNIDEKLKFIVAAVTDETELL
jgi:hypothetical protein